MTFLFLCDHLNCEPSPQLFPFTGQWVNAAGTTTVVNYEMDYFDPQLERNFVSFCRLRDISDKYCRMLFQDWYVDVVVESKSKAPLEILQNIRYIDQLLPSHGELFRYSDVFKYDAIMGRTETTDSLTATEDFVIDQLLPIIITELSSTTNSMQPRLGFLHSCSVPYSTHNILTHLLDEIIASGLMYSLNNLVVLNFGAFIPANLVQHYSQRHPNIIFVQTSTDVTWGELPTIRVLHKLTARLAEAHPTLQVLYLHTKGVSYIKTNALLDLWVDMMVGQVVREHVRNYHLLASGVFDIVGECCVNLFVLKNRVF